MSRSDTHGQADADADSDYGVEMTVLNQSASQGDLPDGQMDTISPAKKEKKKRRKRSKKSKSERKKSSASIVVDEDASVDMSCSVDQQDDGSDSSYGVEQMSNEKPSPAKKTSTVTAAIPPKSRAGSNHVMAASVPKQAAPVAAESNIPVVAPSGPAISNNLINIMPT